MHRIGIHFGTFVGAESESLEAIIELQQAVEDAGVKTLEDPNEDEKGRMGVVDLGETYIVPSKPSLCELGSGSVDQARANLENPKSRNVRSLTFSLSFPFPLRSRGSRHRLLDWQDAPNLL